MNRSRQVETSGNDKPKRCPCCGEPHEEDLALVTTENRIRVCVRCGFVEEAGPHGLGRLETRRSGAPLLAEAGNEAVDDEGALPSGRSNPLLGTPPLSTWRPVETAVNVEALADGVVGQLLGMKLDLPAALGASVARFQAALLQAIVREGRQQGWKLSTVKALVRVVGTGAVADLLLAGDLHPIVERHMLGVPPFFSELSPQRLARWKSLPLRLHRRDLCGLGVQIPFVVGHDRGDNHTFTRLWPAELALEALGYTRDARKRLTRGLRGCVLRVFVDGRIERLRCVAEHLMLHLICATSRQDHLFRPSHRELTRRITERRDAAQEAFRPLSSSFLRDLFGTAGV